MKKFTAIIILFALILSVAGCGNKNKEEAATDYADEPIVIDTGDESESEEAESEEAKSEEAESEEEPDYPAAVENYCYKTNPDLKEIVESGQEVSWEIESSDEKEVVVLYRSYTGAEVRYYIDRASGETYVTEFVQGITPEEERTDETFNIKDYTDK